jgi:EAL domain-containing protein (putative c-di-GMP-specific phosphodiesterase class I)
VRAIVTLGDTLGKSVVAEGIETHSELMQLHDLGCENGQGFHLSRPLNVAEVESLLDFLTAEHNERRMRVYDTGMSMLQRH